MNEREKMMTMSTPEEHAMRSFDGPGPGKHLQTAREEAHLTVSIVATKLHLRTEVIEMMERDDYHHAPDFVFVRGYLRAYAKLLHLSPDEVIAMFDFLQLEKPKRIHGLIQGKKQSINKERSARWISFLIIVVLVVAFSFWQHGHSILKTPEASSVKTPLRSQKNVDLKAGKALHFMDLKPGVWGSIAKHGQTYSPKPKE